METSLIVFHVNSSGFQYCDGSIALILNHFVFTEINSCAVNNGGCHQNATCSVDINLPGFRSCKCNGGFTGDGFFCFG